MKVKPTLTLSTEQLQDVRDHIKNYFLEEHDIEIGDLQADLFLEFLNAKIGKHFYNQGITDAMNSIQDKTQDLVLLLKE